MPLPTETLVEQRMHTDIVIKCLRYGQECLHRLNVCMSGTNSLSSLDASTCKCMPQQEDIKQIACLHTHLQATGILTACRTVLLWDLSKAVHFEKASNRTRKRHLAEKQDHTCNQKDTELHAAQTSRTRTHLTHKSPEGVGYLALLQRHACRHHRRRLLVCSGLAWSCCS